MMTGAERVRSETQKSADIDATMGGGGEKKLKNTTNATRLSKYIGYNVESETVSDWSMADWADLS